MYYLYKQIKPFYITSVPKLYSGYTTAVFFPVRTGNQTFGFWFRKDKREKIIFKGGRNQSRMKLCYLFIMSNTSDF